MLLQDLQTVMGDRQTVPFKFKLANLFPNFFYLTIFHNKFLSGPAKRKKIKTWHKNCYIITADIKINSKNISDKNNRKVYDKEERDKL